MIVKATEWNDAKLKLQEEAQNDCLIKDVPNTFQKLLQTVVLDSAGDSMEPEEYSEEFATSSSWVSCRFVKKYMNKIVGAITKAEPSEELAKCKQVVKHEFHKIEFLFLAKSHRLLQTYCELAVRGFDATASAEQQAELMIHNFDQLKTDACLAPYLLTDTTSSTAFVKGKTFLDYIKSLLHLVQHAVTLYKSAEASNFSDDISAHASQWMLGGNEDQKLVCNVLEQVDNVKNGFDDEKWAAVIERWKQLAPALLKVWSTIDNVVVTRVKHAFAERLALWESRISQGPSMEDLYTPIKNAQWGDDPIVQALAERAQDSAESDSDFLLLKRVSALCGPHELASIHVAKGLAMFKCKAASVCYKVAASRRQSLPAPLSVKDGEQATAAIIAKYEELISDFEGVALEASSAVSDLKVLRESWMKAPRLLSSTRLLNFV